MYHQIDIHPRVGVGATGDKLLSYVAECTCNWRGAPRARRVDAMDDATEHRLVRERMDMEDARERAKGGS